MTAAMRSGLAGWAGVLVGTLLGLWLLLWPSAAWGSSDGAALFSQHCAGCHVNGGNIIRRGKTLKLAALERQGLASTEAIAAIAANGLGQMGGYGTVLGQPGVEQVADYVWQQAQAGWPKG
jgi:cytochrome c6